MYADGCTLSLELGVNQRSTGMSSRLLISDYSPRNKPILH